MTTTNPSASITGNRNPAAGFTFKLQYRQWIICYLQFNGELWTFRYSAAFQQQKQLAPIINFPDIYREYRSTVLFSYFSYRIPSLRRSLIKKAIEQNKLDENNIVELLRHFGRRTIVNPFELHPA